MKLKHIGLIFFLLIPLLYACGGEAAIPEALEPGVFPPSQINSSMVGQVVKVRGKVNLVVENPGGLGGLYLELTDVEAEIGVRIQDNIWQTLDEKEKNQFREGNNITAEGILFQAGKQLVVIWGKLSPDSYISDNSTE